MISYIAAHTFNEIKLTSYQYENTLVISFINSLMCKNSQIWMVVYMFLIFLK